jgi:hypothetical protein
MNDVVTITLEDGDTVYAYERGPGVTDEEWQDTIAQVVERIAEAA